MPSVNKVVYSGRTLIDLTNDTVTAAAMRKGYTAHDRSGAQITGTIPDQAAQTITPGTADRTIPSGRYLAGTQTIKGDPDLIPANIKKGVNIFNVTGTMEDGPRSTPERGNPAPRLGAMATSMSRQNE